jgi:L-seryl-tRNA(Ser) seleniumtransferase
MMDPRRRVPRTDGVLADPRLVAAREVLGGALVAAAGCTDVEFDLASGQCGRRGAGALDALARAVPAAGAVHVVNNNAAALALAATALAAGRRKGHRRNANNVQAWPYDGVLTTHPHS